MAGHGAGRELKNQPRRTKPFTPEPQQEWFCLLPDAKSPAQHSELPLPGRCQSRMQGSLNRSVLIWAPSNMGRVILLGTCTLESLPDKKKISIEMNLRRSSLVWVCSCLALTSPIPSNRNYSVLLLQGTWTSTPRYSMASCWHIVLVQLQVKKLNRHFLLSLCPAGFTSSQLWL